MDGAIGIALLVLIGIAARAVSQPSWSGGFTWLVWVLPFVWLVVMVCYAAVSTGLKGQTLGKRVAGIEVLDATDAGRIGVGRSFLRYVVLATFGLIPLFIGYLSPFFDKSGQLRGWHDLAANSRVVLVPPRRMGPLFPD